MNSQMEIRRERSARVQSSEASVSVELGHVALPAYGVFTNLEALQILYFWIFMEALSHRHNDRSLPSFPAPLPSPENEGWG